MQEAHAIHHAFLTQRMESKPGRKWPGLAQQYCVLGAVMARDPAPQPTPAPQPPFSQTNKDI